MDNQDIIKFSFGWLALELLGKNLYSNAWSAIAELVANGFDAQANNVYVYINNNDKENAIIEIFDDGKGMGIVALRDYVKVGRNKREKIKDDKIRSSLMGRKGIGKLAALYLSNLYYMQTKTERSLSTWRMQFNKTANKDEQPFLQRYNRKLEINCIDKWEEINKGTLLKLTNVNLSGLGEVAFQSLEQKLANNFALDTMKNKKIHLCVDSTGNNKHFNVVNKHIAFKNMAFICQSPFNDTASKDMLNSFIGGDVKLENVDLNHDDPYTHSREVYYMRSSDEYEISDYFSSVGVNGVNIRKKYSVKGWLGIHSSIKTKIAQQNDSNFTKSSTYNPAQVRLYVRNKLAIENILNLINNTQAFVNYIEGEIHFDILDDDDFPDIATSNRQGLDENDKRIKILISIVSKNIDELINKRNELAQKMKKRSKKLKDNAKLQFAKEVSEELNVCEKLTDDERNDLTITITNKIQGDVDAKINRLVFISHSRADKRFSHFFYFLLRKKGVREKEIFYTSKNDDYKDDLMPLAERIKQNITKDSALIIYLPSKYYKKSEFCMFEGGAGWATKGVGEYLMAPVYYEDIPKFLTNGKKEFSIIDFENPTLTETLYQHLVFFLNRMIEHINGARQISEEKTISLFPEVKFPDAVQKKKENKKDIDYMDKEIVEYWKTYVNDGLQEYIDKYRTDA